MKKDTVVSIQQPATTKDALTEVLREGAQKLLAEAVQAEVASFVEQYQDLRNEQGRQRVVRNGYLPEREIQTGLGGIKVRVPRTRDRAPAIEPEQVIRFRSSLVPPYLCRSKSVEELLPLLYLKGISTRDFREALSALLGPNAPGLSAKTISRLKQKWLEDYEKWRQRDLSRKIFVYLWADGIHCNARMEDGRLFLLVLIGARADGKKELIAIEDGYRESEQPQWELLRDLHSRGLTVEPKLAVGDGAIGSWKALARVSGNTRQQRCWMHKRAMYSTVCPKQRNPRPSRRYIRSGWPRRGGDAYWAFDAFIATYELKYPKATACLEKDREDLLAFYDFPAEHWVHLRTTNPIESTFATVRLWTAKTRGCLSRQTMLTMVFKLCRSAESRWFRLRGYRRLGEVIENVRFVKGVRDDEVAA